MRGDPELAKTKPRLTLLKGLKATDVDALAKVYERVTGRKPRPKFIPTKPTQLAPHVDLLYKREALNKALVLQVKDELMRAVRPKVDTWPISNDAIVMLSLGCDTAGQPLPPLALAYFEALRCCVLLEEATEWNEVYAGWLVAALYRCEAMREALRGRKAGAIGENQKALRNLLKEDRSADENALRHRMRKLRPDHGLKDDSFKVEVSRARKALGIKKS